jgi:Fe2+ or Zn2+ uptake regulation protein
MNLSIQMHEILLRSQRMGRISIQEIVEQRIAEGVKLSVARASVSRTLRRLWLLGLIELHSFDSADYRWCATVMRLNAQKVLERVKQDPQAQYREWVQCATGLARMAGFSFSDHYGSAEAFLAEKERAFAECPRIRARYVEATAQGLQTVNSRYECKVNRNGKMAKNCEVNRFASSGV